MRAMNERVNPVPTYAVPGQSSERPAGDSIQGRERWKRHGVIGGIALVLIAAVGVAIWAFSGGPSVHYVTAPVTRGAITRTVTATGTVNPELTIIVGTYVSGVIQELRCDYNTEVKKGQICAKIDPRPYQSVVDQARATLAIARAQLEKDKASLTYARLALDRAAVLVKTNAVSQDTLDNAKSTYDQTLAQIGFDEATIQQRQAALDAAQVNLDYTDIVSPVDGTVVSRNVTMGQTVAASFQTPTLFLIASDLGRMEVDTNVSEGDIGGIKIGNKATFSVDAFSGRIFRGAVTQVRQSPQTVQNVVTYDVVVSVANPDLALKPGMTASTRVVVDERSDVIRVPNQALRYAPAGTSRESGARHVWVLRGDEPVAVQVKVGLDDDNFTEVVADGLQPGEQVITREQAAQSRTNTPKLRF
jgi:HlyD family secretion protein